MGEKLGLDVVDSLGRSVPLVFMVPRNEIPVFLAPKGIQLPLRGVRDPRADQMRSKLSETPELLSSVLADLETELPELASIKFRKPALKCDKWGQFKGFQMDKVDRLILDKFEDIDRQQVVKPGIKMKRIKLSYEKQRLFEVKLKAKLDAQRQNKRQRAPEEPQNVSKQRKVAYLATDDVVQKSIQEITNALERHPDSLPIDATNKIYSNICRLQQDSEEFARLDLNILLQLQNSCANSLENFNHVAIELQNSTEFLLSAITAASSAVLMMQLFLSKRDERQLFLQSHLNSCVDFIYLVLEDLILPAAKLVVSDERIDQRDTYIKLQNSLVDILNQLNQYIKQNHLDETFLTRLEYMTMMVVFTEFNIKERSSLVGITALENLRISCCDLICTIFNRFEDQRQFILAEIFNGIDKLPTNKNHARQFKLTRGINVQLVSILLVRLIQTFDLAEDTNEDIVALLESTHLSKRGKEDLRVLQESFQNSVADKFKEIESFSNQISSGFLNKFTKSVDPNSKHVFEIVLEDLLNVVAFPEWSGAETLLSSLMRSLMAMFESESCSAQGQTFALEMIGSIGCTIIQLKNQHELISLNYNMSTFDFNNLVRDYTTCLAYMFKARIAGNKFLTLKALQSINEMLFQCRAETDTQLSASCIKFQKSLIQSLHAGNFPVPSNQAINLNLELSTTSYRRILLTTNLLYLFDNFLTLVIKSLNHTKIKSRTRAIKNLSSLIIKEPSLISSNLISNSVISRLNDDSAQVKDAVIELIGQLILSNAELIDEYYQAVCAKMGDPSIAVRKRVMRLAKELYFETEKIEIKSHICEKFLARLEDEEDSVIETSRSSLLNFWFLTPTDETVMSTLDVIFDCIEKSDKNWELFTMFLSEHVLFRYEDEPESLYQKIMHALKTIIDAILDLIIRYVDNEEWKPKIAKAMGLLSVITKVDGKLISQDQLICLKPYLTDEGGTGDIASYYTLSIFKHALPEATALKPSFIKDCQISLLKRLTKFNVKELGEAMPCAWMLSSMKKDTIRMATAAVSCLNLTRPYLKKLNELSEFDPKLLRLLFLIGNFGKYCDFNSHKELFVRIGLNQNESTISIFVKFLLCFTNENVNHQIRRAAIKNLIYCCSSHPRLLMTDPILQIMDKSLEGDEVDIQAVIIQEFIEFLEYEESINFKETRKSSSGSNKLDISTFHGNSSAFVADGICSAIVQRYMDSVLKMCLYDNGGHSRTATRYLQLVVKFGFANPKSCIPTIIALESSPVFFLRSRALTMHKELLEKHESLIESGYIEGIKLAFEYRKRLSPLYFMNETGFFKTFFQVIQESKNAKKKFLINFTKSWITTKEDLQDLKQYTIFVLLNLANVPYDTLEEIYIICHAIDKLISNNAVTLSVQISQGSDSPEQWEAWCLQSQIFVSFLRFRQFLFQNFNLDEEKAEEYRPNRADKELRTPPKLAKEIKPLQLQDLFTCKKKYHHAVSLEFVELINDFHQVV